MPKERVVQAEGIADTKALRQEQEKAGEEAAGVPRVESVRREGRR